MSASSTGVSGAGQEANSQWIGFFTAWAERAPISDIRDLEGLRLAWSNTLLPVFNQAIVCTEVRDEADLSRRLSAANSFAASRQLPWVFALPEDLLPEQLIEPCAEVLKHAGMELMFRSTGMIADHLVAPPKPPELTISRVAGPDLSLAVGDLNCAAYGMPEALGRDFFQHSGIWRDTDFGYVGSVQGQAASTATVSLVQGRLYAACVATAQEHQRKGYASAVLYHALDQARRATGAHRSVLHATPAGYPIYERMGYRPVNMLQLWTVQH